MKTVLVVGATGYLGGKVIHELRKHKVHIRALVREGSDASKLKSQNVEVIRGDLTRKETLSPAVCGTDAIVTTAIGYVNRRKGDTLKSVDDAGNKNLADVAKSEDIPRFIFTSVLNCEKAPTVPHFWQKKLTEDYFDQIGLNYVSIRPGSFINQDPKHDFFAKGIRKGNLKVMATKTRKWTQVLVEDVARYLTTAALDEKVPFAKINIGNDEAMSMEMMAAYIREYTGEPLKLGILPWPVVGTMLRIMGLFKPVFGDAKKMFDFFFTGNYSADVSLQTQVFGKPPGNRESVFRYCEQLGLTRKV